ncbi:hypothetical protein ACIGBL_24660 [Streptomyces sp. NPDC085614]|uniref:hypothetical protein n=1 Tax=Streptomyces sp. NPDC085614 TaxID=3365733 RepID=UPI0037D18A3D
MSYSERWQELFGPTDGGADRGGATMTLASTAPDPGSGGGQGKLKHSGGPWTSASGTSAELRTSTETSRAALGPGHEGMEAGAAGFASVAAVRSVLKSWEDRLAAVRDECDALEGALLTVAKEMGETEVAIEKSFRTAGGTGAKPGEKR